MEKMPQNNETFKSFQKKFAFQVKLEDQLCSLSCCQIYSINSSTKVDYKNSPANGIRARIRLAPDENLRILFENRLTLLGNIHYGSCVGFRRAKYRKNPKSFVKKMRESKGISINLGGTF